jgi:8-oxo-dGTP pyrophosphatase MutT (NUDIX family)
MADGATETDTHQASPAATVVLLRNAPLGFELLLVQRAAELAYHGGAWVFPGGRVDPTDHVGNSEEICVARKAAVREVAEETGLALSAEELLPLSHWTSPKGRARSFATWFFLAHVTTADVRVDGREIKNHLWTTPAAALALRDAGELVLPAPTFVTLVGLSSFADHGSALAAAAARVPEVFQPRPRQVDGGMCSLYRGDVAYAEGDIDQPGPRHRLWMLDRGWSYERSET